MDSTRTPTEPDWDLLLDVARSLAADLDPSDADDLTQETLLSYVSFSRRERDGERETARERRREEP